VISPGLLAELKEAVTALMVVTVAASVYGGVKGKEVSGAISIAFVFASVFAIALWATALLGLGLASAAGAVALYIAVIWAGIAVVLLILTLGFVISTIIALNEVLALRSFIADMRIWTEREAGLWLPAAVARAIASSIKDGIKELYIAAYIYAVITAAGASYLVFLAR